MDFQKQLIESSYCKVVSCIEPSPSCSVKWPRSWKRTKSLQNSFNQTWSRLRNRHRKPIRINSRSFRFRFVPIRFEISKSRIVIDYFNFDFGIYMCMFSEKSVLFRYYRNVTDSYRKKVMTIKITVLLPIFVPPSLYNRFDTDVYNK